MLDMEFYSGKRVLVTGHTGFKGAWMCQLLTMAGAKVTGYALKPPTDPNLFGICGLSGKMNSVVGDIRDLAGLRKVFYETMPEIVIHMAAQPLVRESYKEPAYTYETNVMGTVNVLECVRTSRTVKSFVNVTTDKVYFNKEWEWGYRESDELNGFDPYSNSKSCAELVTSCYVKSFLCDMDVAVSTARAGNVIGGGDFAEDRIIPDCVRAAKKKEKIVVRNPFSTRPYQHVLEPVTAYLLIAEAQYKDKGLAGNYNIGPDESGCLTTGELVELFCRKWNERIGDCIQWVKEYDGGPHEANFLKLDCSRIRHILGWKSRWRIEQAVEKVVDWTKYNDDGGDISGYMCREIREFLQIQNNGIIRNKAEEKYG